MSCSGSAPNTTKLAAWPAARVPTDLDYLARAGWEDRGMRRDQHALAMGLSCDRRHQRCRQVCIQLDRCRPCALRPCHSQPQIRLRSDSLHPGSFSGLNSARRVVRARVCKERRTREQGGIMNVRRDDFVRTGLARTRRFKSNEVARSRRPTPGTARNCNPGHHRARANHGFAATPVGQSLSNAVCECRYFE